jgi:hypothetical protein
VPLPARIAASASRPISSPLLTTISLPILTSIAATRPTSMSFGSPLGL